MSNLVSVIIPVYNRQKYIAECIQSVYDSSYSNIETLIIDDGSTDNTLEISKDLEKQYPNIRIFVSQHLGVSAARNIGIEAAQGKYLFFMDSDDVIHPRLLETLVDALESGKAEIAGTYSRGIPEKYWDKVPELIARETGSGDVVYRNYEESLEAIFSGGTAFSTGGVMLSKELIGDTRFRTDLFIGEDFYFAYENLLKQVGTALLNRCWYYGRLHENNSSWSFGYAGFRNRLYRRELVWKSEEAHGRQEYAKRQKREGFYFCITCLRKNKPYSEDCKKMRKVLREYKRELFPALKLKHKLAYYVFVYFPFASFIFKQ